MDTYLAKAPKVALPTKQEITGFPGAQATVSPTAPSTQCAADDQRGAEHVGGADDERAAAPSTTTTPTEHPPHADHRRPRRPPRAGRRRAPGSCSARLSDARSDRAVTATPIGDRARMPE